MGNGGILSRRSTRARVLAGLLLGLTTLTGLLVPSPSYAATVYTVNATDDVNDGACNVFHCSLREAITAANANPGADTIVFDFGGASLTTINVTSDLPKITDPVTIDGQAPPNCSPTSAPKVELNGSATTGATLGLQIDPTGGGSTISGLVINRFANVGIFVASNGNSLRCNYIGTDASGQSDLGNGSDGIQVRGDNNELENNLISGNTAHGLNFSGSAETATGNTVTGNRIGTNSTGTQDLGNGLAGVSLSNATSNTIGGSGAESNLISGNDRDGVFIMTNGNTVVGNRIGTNAAGIGPVPNGWGVRIQQNGSGNTVTSNLISGNSDDGVLLSSGATGNVVRANDIGTAVDGTTPLGNRVGVNVTSTSTNTIGGTGATDGNTIAHNAKAGVRVAGATGISVLGNSIFSNTALGIDLGMDPTTGHLGTGDGVTLNDPDDADAGPNNLQNFPVITSSKTSTTSTRVSGSIDSAPSTSYRLEFFSSPACDASGHGEGRNFLGFTTVLTDPSGVGSFTATLPNGAQPGEVITATATDPAGNTSEFSACSTPTQIDEGPQGQLAYRKFNPPGGQTGIYTANVDGTNEVLAVPGDFDAPDWSPDGGKLVFHTQAPGVQSDLWTSDPDGSSLTKLTNDSFSDLHPAWSPDGNKVAFVSNRSGNFDLWVINRDGTGLTHVLSNPGDIEAEPSWSPDGSTLVFRSSNRIVKVGINGTGFTVLVNNLEDNNISPDWSPDGSTIVYVSDRDAPTFNYRMWSVPSGGGTPTFVGNGFTPNYSPDGQFLAYHNADDTSEGIWISASDGSNGSLVIPNGAHPTWGPPEFDYSITDLDDTNDGTCDAFHCSFREAINAANATPKKDKIRFGVAGSGPHTISPGSPLPSITAPVDIDGGTLPGCAGAPAIVLDGASAGASAVGLNITGGNSSVRGLVVSHWSDIGIQLASANNVVQCNRVGTTPNGLAAAGNTRGIRVLNASDNLIGGTAAGQGNVVAASTFQGIDITGATSQRNHVEGNKIGTDLIGTTALGNQFGVGLGGSENVIGGSVPGARNVISGNSNDGVRLPNGSNTQIVEGNWIGVNGVNGLSALPNSANGIFVNGVPEPDAHSNKFRSNVISGNLNSGVQLSGVNATGNEIKGNLIGLGADGTTPVRNGPPAIPAAGWGVIITGPDNDVLENTIAHNGTGVQVGTSPTGGPVGVVISENSIFSNGALGIDLAGNGVTPNDADDLDSGPNDLQNFPVVTGVSPIAVVGTLDTHPSTTYQVEVFSSSACDPSNHGEGKDFVASGEVVTDADGQVPFSVPVGDFDLNGGEFITATVRSPQGNTSEFSECFRYPVPGTIIVEKKTLPDEDPTEFSFSGALSGSIEDDETLSVSVPPGEHVVTETDPGVNWRLASIACDDANSSRNGESASVTFRVAEGETVKCTFTNQGRARVRIKKVTTPAGGQDFEFVHTLGSNPPGLPQSVDDGEMLGGYEDVGQQQVFSETAKQGWYLDDIDCDDHPRATINEAQAKVTFNPAVGDDILCTFTNERESTLIVKKTTQPSSAQSFNFSGPAGAFDLSHNETETIKLPKGTYEVTEAAPGPAYSLGSITCDDANSTSDVGARKATYRLEPDETVTCTFVNNGVADLSITKTQRVLNESGDFTSGNVTAQLGDQVRYRLTVRNDGVAPATGVQVTDDLHDSLRVSLLTSPCTESSGEVVNCNLGTVEPGAEVVTAMTARVSGTCDVVGTRSDDRNPGVIGSAASEIICGAGGGDVIRGGGGADVIYGNGPAHLNGSTFTNQASVSSASADQDTQDHVTAVLGGTIQLKGDGPDRINAGGGFDRAFGQENEDWIHGDDGRDALFGGPDADILWSDEGSNAGGGDGEPDRLEGGSGPDTLVGQAGSNITNADVAGGLTAGLWGDGGNDYIIGGPSGDDIFGGDGSDLLKGGAGVDRLAGDAGGEGGASPASGGNDPDLIDGEEGNDLLYGQGGNDGWCSNNSCSAPRFVAGNPDLRVDGTVAAGLEGAGGRDVVHGGAGHDRLDGGALSGNVLVGGENFDFCSFGPGSGDLRHPTCERPSVGTSRGISPARWAWDGFR